MQKKEQIVVFLLLLISHVKKTILTLSKKDRKGTYFHFIKKVGLTSVLIIYEIIRVAISKDCIIKMYFRVPY